MASPFSVFRKNQRVLMALAVGFSMFAFIVADVITPQNFPIFLGALLGALALWLLSGKGGTEGWLIAVVGGILGGLVGTFGPGFIRDDNVVYTDRGNLSIEQIETINRRQDLANRFLGMAYSTVVEKTPEDQRRSIPQPQPFGFMNVSDTASMRENAVLTYLFDEEADEMGISLDDRDVTRFIEDVTGGRLSTADLRRIRTEMQVGTGELVDVLREQIRARDAFLLLVPRPAIAPSPTPLELWNDFKKLQNEAQVTVATIPTSAFTSEVPAPGDAKLAAFFEQYRNVPPSPDGTPGFLVPRQVQVAYVELSLEDVKKTVTPPTEAEVLAYYEKNRAQFEFSKERPGATSTSGNAGEPTAGSPVEAPRPATGTTADGKANENNEKKENGSATPTPSPTPSPGEDAPTGEQPTDEPPTGEDSKKAAPLEAPAPEQSAVQRDDREFVAFQADAPADPATSATPATGDSPDAATSASEPPAFAAPSKDDAATGNAEAGNAASPTPPSAATLEQIRRQLLTQRARDAADARLEQVRDDVDRILEEVMEAIPLPDDPQDPEQRKAFEARRRDAAKTVVKRIEAYAKKNGLLFQSTPYMSYSDLSTSDDYSIGKAIRWEKNAPLFGRETTPVADVIFSSTAEQPLATIPAQSLLNDSRYVAVKVDDVPPRAADLSEDGMREKVLEAWKQREARQLAADRAKELAEKAKKSGLEQAMKAATVTGKPDGKPLTTSTVGPFTWLRRSSAPRTDFAPNEILPTELPQLPAAGEAFMKTVFKDLEVGKIGVAPAQDESAYYVIHVDSKSLESNLAKIRESFMREDFFHDPLDQFVGQPMNPFRRRQILESRQTMEEWIKQFREQHGVDVRPLTES